ncbi:cadherin-7 [Oryzias melastigma]|uniref:cadherin-7 n=1 Tax=Oryzias melastigma TaxID=30732 RepID=UPI00168D455B|nr:cadherin-7 [Oryzias melastigma]
MSHCLFLSVLCWCVLSKWEQSGCKALTLNSVILHQISGGGAGVYQRRRRRSWVWNQFFVLEEYTGDEPLYIGKLHSDMDKGDGKVKYFLAGDGAMSIFTINEETGDIHAIKRLDREQQPYYTLRAQARDKISNMLVEPESQFIIKVQDINDNAPRFLDGPYSAQVDESSPVGTSVVTVVATDADDPTYGNSARLVYSILQGEPYFSVEPKTGVILTALPDLDREARDQYLLVILAKDMVGQMGGLSGTTSVTVTLTDINDNPPRFPLKLYQFTVPESALILSVVAKIKAVDLDLGQNAEMDYKILDGDEVGTFGIITDPDTQEGLIILHTPLDFESRSSFSLHVEVSNRIVDPRFLLVGPFSDLTTVQLQVEDVNEPPVFTPPVSWMMVSEGAPVGTVVGSVSASDPDDSNSPVRYAIDKSSDLERHFSIDSSSGVIRTNKHLDRESRALHNITITATEKQGPSLAGSAVVLISVTDVNDNAPSFARKYQTSVCENALPGQVVETLSAVDPDEPERGHRFLFSLTAANHSFTLTDNHDNTASVLTRQTGLLRRDQSMHFLPVVISDGGRPSLSSTNTLTITVCSCDLLGGQRLCHWGAPHLQGILSAATVLTCVVTLLGVVIVTTVIRCRKQQTRILDHEQDIQENIVYYDDEGGGEEDTEAFDMSALRHLNQTKLTRLPNSRTEKHRMIQEFIRDRLQVADQDLTAPPFDSLQTYNFEGLGSAAVSLSSLNSQDSRESEGSYSFLKEWGPRFRKLAELYSHHKGGRWLDLQESDL